MYTLLLVRSRTGHGNCRFTPKFSPMVEKHNGGCYTIRDRGISFGIFIFKSMHRCTARMDRIVRATYLWVQLFDLPDPISWPSLLGCSCLSIPYQMCWEYRSGNKSVRLTKTVLK